MVWRTLLYCPTVAKSSENHLVIDTKKAPSDISKDDNDLHRNTDVIRYLVFAKSNGFLKDGIRYLDVAG